MFILGFTFAIFFFLLSFVIGKLSDISYFWISFWANTGFFLSFLAVQNAFPENAQIALQSLTFGIGFFLILQSLCASGQWILKNSKY